MIALRHAWLQKHPSPVAAGGEFHWYPREGDRELRTQIVERMRGLEPPAVLWELAPGRIVWARAFAAIAPIDGRRYVGLVMTVAEGLANPCDLLCALDVPAAAPWTSNASTGHARSSELPGPAELAEVAPSELVALSRGLLSGGTQRLADPHAADLPLLAAALERQLPETLTPKLRRGAWLADGDRVETHDRVAELFVAAARSPTSDEARAWRLLCDLAETRREPPDAVAEADPLTVEERALSDRSDLTSQLHAWGRGRFDHSPTVESLVDRLADAVALRVLAELERGGDPRRPIAEARWYSLLPARRREQLLATLVTRASSLRSLVEAPHG
jgi:hypothetical protein